MTHLNVLFMGASGLVGLLERFQAAARAEEIGLRILSLEDSSPWHAISVAAVGQVISAPSFRGEAFEPFLSALVEKEGISIVIPCIDAATIALCGLRTKYAERGVSLVVSSRELCEAMHDKAQAEVFFQQHNIPTPLGTVYPVLAKPRFGASSRGQVLLGDAEELEFWLRRNDRDKFVLQPFIQGTEYSVDAYVSRAGRPQGAVSRVREVVSGGEAMVTRTHHNPRVEAVVDRFLQIPGWQGPLTVQVIDAGENAYVIECNPRVGSGVTCSIEAGLDVPRWIMREHLGRPLPADTLVWKSGLCMTRSRKDHFLWLS